MPRIAILSLAVALVFAAGGCSPKPAEKTDPATGAPSGRDAARLEAGAMVADLMAPTFSGDQQGRIQNMSYFMAASALCPALEVDPQKMGKAVEAVLALDAADETPDDRQYRHDAVLMFLGMSTGAMIGSHVEDKAQFCQDALKLKGGAPETHLFTLGAPSAPSTTPLPGSETAKP